MKNDMSEAGLVGDESMPWRELRVLRGAHAGASTPLRESEGNVSIGACEGHDIILRDAPVFALGATIALEAHGWRWAQRKGGKPIFYPLGSPVRFGSVIITVDRAQAPWPDIETLAIESDTAEEFDLHELDDLDGADDSNDSEEAADPQISRDLDGAHTTSDHDVAVKNALLTSSSSEAGASELQSLQAATGARSGSWLRSRTIRWVLLPTVVALAFVAAAVNVLTPPVTQAPAPEQPARALKPETVLDVLSSLGLSESLKVVGTKSGGLELLGVVQSDLQRDELRAALMALDPVPLSVVLTHAEFKTEVDALARTLEPGLSLSVQGPGKLLLSGIASERTELDALLQRITVELPTALHLEKMVKTSPEIVTEFMRELNQLGLPIRAKWEDRKMLVKGKLPEGRIAQWEELLLRFNDKYGKHITFHATIDDGRQARERHVAMGSDGNSDVLAGVNSIVGGDTPYVVLADGRKINVGGTLNGHELIGIRDGSLILRVGQGPLREVSR